MNKRNFLVCFLCVGMLAITSCKSCKNKFAKNDAQKTEVGGLDTSIYAGLNDSSTATDGSNTSATDAHKSDEKTSANSNSSNTSTATIAADNNSSVQNSTSQKNEPYTVGQSTSSTGKRTVAAVQSASADNSGSRHYRGGGVSRSIYDGVNDQEERYVVRKAEGYNDAYYIDDYNGTNKFYEEHYKKASTLDKPAESYIDKSMNLPSASYAKGPTQKSIDALNPPVVVEDKTPKEKPKASGSGTIGISKKSVEPSNGSPKSTPKSK